MPKTTTITKSALLVIAIAGSGFAIAHGGATGIVKERMDDMSAMGKAMKTIVKQLKNKTSMDAGAVIQSSQLIVKHSSMIPQMFPQGTHGKPSEALPAIWTNWNDFTAAADKTKDEANKLQQLMTSEASHPQLMKQFATLGKTCKGCHTDFRAAKE